MQNIRGDNLKHTRAILLVLFAAMAFGLGEPPVILEEPDFTFGTTNTICWELPEGATPTAYKVFVSEFDDPIGPISLAAASGECYEVGATGEALLSGVEYCYRMIYRYRDDGENFWSDTSNLVCSTQDGLPPELDIEDLDVWTNLPSVMINFTVEDEICGWVDAVKLYYRESDSLDWTYYSTRNIVTGGGEDSISFTSTDVTGDTYYEFRLAGIDSLGNERVPIGTVHSRHTWTRFDTERPTSSIITDDLPLYDTVSTLTIPYTAMDTYSGVDTLRLLYTRNDGPEMSVGRHVWGGVPEVDSFFTFTSVDDGHFKMWTYAVDSARNAEDISGFDVEFYLDTHDPEFEANHVYDLTMDPERYQVPAESLWTNERMVKVAPVDPMDPIFAEYASGIDSIHIAEDRDFTVNYVTLPWTETGMFDYELTDADGSKQVFIKLQDVAGNICDYKNAPIMLDRIAPALNSVVIADADDPDLPTEETDEATVALNIDFDGSAGSWYKMYVTDDPEDLNSIDEFEWIDPEELYFFDFIDPTPSTWIHVYVVTKDSAGNVSEMVTDSIYYDLGIYFVEITDIYDLDDWTPAGFTDMPQVKVDLSFGRDVDSVVIWDDDGFDSTFAVTTGGAETGEVTIDYFEFSERDGERMIYCHGISDIRPDPTHRDSMTIVLDSRNPALGSVTLHDITDGFDPDDLSEESDPGYTNERNIRAYFLGASDDRSGLFRMRLTCEDHQEVWPYAEETFYMLPDGDGEKNVEAQVQDSAGNWCTVRPATIYLDTQDPVYVSLTLEDRTSGSTEYSNETIVRAVIDADDGMSGSPAYVAFFEDPTRYADDLTDLWRPYSPTMICTLSATLGERTLYSALKDQAGNISVRVSDAIIYDTGITLDLQLFDQDRRSEEYTNENTIIAGLGATGTPPAFYYLSESPDLPATPEWLPYEAEVPFTLSTGEGDKTVYGWLKSESDIISERSEAEIRLDKTAPVLTSGFMIYDTTSVEHFPTVFKGHMGWSNEAYVYGAMTDVNDDPETGSGVDSLGFFGPLQPSLWGVSHPPYTAVDGGITVRYFPEDSIPLLLDTSTQGQKWITGRAIDGAGNWGNPIDPQSEIIVYGGYDITAPTLEFRHPLTGNMTDSTGVRLADGSIPIHIIDGPDEGHLWKVCFWFDEVPDTNVCVEYDSTWGSGPVYNVSFPMYGVVQEDMLYSMHAVSVDSAGNPSPVDDMKLWVIRDTIDLRFVVTDPVDTADTEYTNSRDLRTVIDIVGTPDSMRFSENPELIGSAWQPFSRESSFMLATATNEVKSVYAQVMHGGHVSQIFHATIILDTNNPNLGAVYSYDRTDGDPNWSDERTIRIEIEGASDLPPGVVHALECAEDPDFTINVQRPTFTLESPEVLYEVNPEPFINPDYIEPGREDQRVIFCRVLDRAENPSTMKHTGIVVDFEEVEVTNHPNPFNPGIGEMTYVRIKSDSKGVAATLSIYDMFGNLVIEKTQSAGSDTRAMDIGWDGKNGNGEVVASGVYIGIVEVGDETYKRKIAVWKGE